uniref:Uncharacterized protein n=1 Tax=viral metagenome TaxID=1070528 RepID=A0A6M3XWB0_9ZZZZ
MVTAKQVINSIKPNITKAPQGQTQKGSAGYDNPREDIEKIKGLREGSIQKVPVNADDITNKAYVDAQFPVTHASTTGQTANDHHVAFVKADADLLYGDIALEHGVNDVNSSSATAAQGALADTALQTETFVAATHTAIGDAAPHHSVNAANTTYTNLVNDSMADALHRHSELSASDGTPNPALSVDATGNVGIGTTGPASKLHVTGAGSADTVLTLGTQDSTPYIKSVNNNLIIQADVQNLFLRTAAGKYVNIDTGSGLLVSGNVGIGTTAPSEKLDVNSDAIRIRTAQTPASAGATGDTGMVCWDANYIYVCVATNTWKRSAIATW